MSDFQEQNLVAPQDEAVNGTVPAEAPVASPEESVAEASAPVVPNRHAEAGRKGAHRIHDLIRLGRLYEQEHGLKRGRLRLRQLIEEGKLYEQEHGLHRPRTKRPRKEQVLRSFLKSLTYMVKPGYRAELAALAQSLVERPARKSA